jgi:hypothetical protein
MCLLWFSNLFLVFSRSNLYVGLSSLELLLSCLELSYFLGPDKCTLMYVQYVFEEITPCCFCYPLANKKISLEKFSFSMLVCWFQLCQLPLISRIFIVGRVALYNAVWYPSDLYWDSYYIDFKEFWSILRFVLHWF